MKIYYLLIAFVFVFCNNPTEDNNNSNVTEEHVNPNSIFKQMNMGAITDVHIEYFKSINSSKPGKTITINNADTIKQIENLLKALPDNGDIFCSFSSEAKKTNLILVDSREKSDTLLLINKKLQTPGTTFYQPTRDEEKRLVNLVIDTVIQNGL
jgi:hypothetical protein